jgi:hypothetical protein
MVVRNAISASKYYQYGRDLPPFTAESFSSYDLAVKRLYELMSYVTLNTYGQVVYVPGYELLI